MYRVSNHVIRNAGLLMRRVNPVELRVVGISRSGVHPQWFKKHREREICPKVEKPLPPLFIPNFYLVMSGLILAFIGGCVVYAKRDKEIRDWLSINAPWFDDLIAIVYEENYPLSTHARNFATAAKEYIAYVMSETPDECKPAVEPPPKPKRPVPVSSPPPAQESIAESDDGGDDDDDDDDEDDDMDEDEKECIIPPKPIISNDICQMEECLKETYLDIMHRYMTVIAYSQYYNMIVRDSLTTFSLRCLKFLKSQQLEREALIDEHITKAQQQLATFQMVAQYVDCGVACSQERLDVSRRQIKDYQDQIKRIQIEFEQVYQEAVQSDRWWKMVECFIDEYIYETNALYPELDWYAKKPSIDGNYDLLLIHNKKYFDLKSAELKDASDYTSARIRRAFELLPLRDKNARLEAAFKVAKADVDKYFNDRMNILKKIFETQLEQEKADQLKYMEKVRANRIATREKDTIRCAEKMVNEMVTEAKKDFTVQLHAFASHLHIVESVLDSKCKGDKEQKRAQELYEASAKLLEKTKKGGPRVCVRRELEALEKNALGDKLVTTVLNAIPYEVRVQGLVPESVIREKYKTMEQIAMKVSMVEAYGSPLLVYGISLFQSMLLFMKPNVVPQAELDDPPKEPFEYFDTYDLLIRARYYLDNGNLAAALQYINALEGASRGAAEAWYKVANAHLQTKQAAEAILAHAASICLQFL